MSSVAWAVLSGLLLVLTVTIEIRCRHIEVYPADQQRFLCVARRVGEIATAASLIALVFSILTS